jgi:5-methylcytosine-specific restriction endonuclease McrA
MASLRDGAERLRSAARRLLRLADDLEAGQAERADFDHVVAEVLGTQRDHFGPRPRASRGAGAKAKILAYLTDHVGREVHGEELAAISGIQEWARRVRELRVEEGWEIAELGSSTYRLESLDANVERALQWQLANEIRSRPGSARSRIEAFLSANVGKIVTREQIDYVSNIAEGSRRVRELRDEAGWPINSHIDEPDLEPGEYRLLSTDPADRREASQRLYPEGLRHRVFERDSYTCQVCRRNREKALAAGDTRFYLEVHHRVAMADELADLALKERHSLDNLITLCHIDHIRETAKLHEKKRRRRGSQP